MYAWRWYAGTPRSTLGRPWRLDQVDALLLRPFPVAFPRRRSTDCERVALEQPGLGMLDEVVEEDGRDGAVDCFCLLDALEKAGGERCTVFVGDKDVGAASEEDVGKEGCSEAARNGASEELVCSSITVATHPIMCESGAHPAHRNGAALGCVRSRMAWQPSDHKLWGVSTHLSDFAEMPLEVKRRTAVSCRDVSGSTK